MQRRSGQGGTFLVHSVQTNVSGKNFRLKSVQLICTILTTLSLSFIQGFWIWHLFLNLWKSKLPKWVEIVYAFTRFFPKIKHLVKISVFYVIRNHKQKWKDLGGSKWLNSLFLHLYFTDSEKSNHSILKENPSENQRLIWSTVLTLMGTKEMLRLYHRLGFLALVDLQSYKSVVVFGRVRVTKIK